MDYLSEAALKGVAEKSLHSFAKQAWPILFPKIEFIENWHILSVCDALEKVTHGEIKNLIVNQPPRCMNSLLSRVFWPCWEWIHHPTRSFLVSTDSALSSGTCSRQTQAIINSDWFQKRWGDRCRLNETEHSAAARDLFNIAGGTRIEAVLFNAVGGVGGAMHVLDLTRALMLPQAGWRNGRDGVTEWWREQISHRHFDPSLGSTALFMPRHHARDLTHHLLNVDGNDYTQIVLPMRFDQNIGFRPEYENRCENGELLWPKRFSEDFVAGIEAGYSPRLFKAAYQQDPMPFEEESAQ